MGSSLPANQSPVPYQGLRLFLIAAVVLAAGLWARYHFATIRISADSAADTHLAAAQEHAQPVLDALEKYHSDNGLYPANLKALKPAYVSPSLDLDAFRYSARHFDWVFRDDTCIDREKNPSAAALQDAAYPNNNSRLQHDCLSGYREYQLQSPDFPPDNQSRALERWAYYDSQPQYWSVGWCEQVMSKGKPRELATNGVCRWQPPTQH